MAVPYAHSHRAHTGSRQVPRRSSDATTGPIPVMVTLSCTHITSFQIRPKTGDLVFCRSCDKYRFVSPTGRAGSNKLGGSRGGGAPA